MHRANDRQDLYRNNCALLENDMTDIIEVNKTNHSLENEWICFILMLWITSMYLPQYKCLQTNVKEPVDEQYFRRGCGRIDYKMWMTVGSTPDDEGPSSRTKHSATLLGNHVYLFGGRNGNLPLKDLWQYSLVEGKWVRLEPKGDRPPCLQEHSAVAYKDCIYIFGGEVGFSSGTETPLWIYNVKENSWRKIRGQKGVANPKGRRGHSALVYKGSMIIYGGYQDLRGSSNELWTYHFATESWHLLSPKSVTDSLQRSSGRHKHSAVLHDGAMWVYGGMTDLQERGDLWRWDIASKLWYNIKSKINPGPLHSHAVCKLPSSMLIFGGESNGQLSNDLWRFHFGTELWEKLQFPGNKPHPRAESIALTVSELLFKNKSDTTNEQEPDLSTSAPIQKTNNQPQNNSTSRSKNFGHNKIGPIEKKYIFNECIKNYARGNLVSNVVQNNNLNFLKEISKLSSINLLRINHKCSYSVLNSSHDSTESLLKGKENSDNEHTPTKMVKSHSANVIANNEKKKTSFTTLTPATDKMPYLVVESGEFSGAESDKSIKPLITRDPISVPNLNDLTSDTSTVSHVYLTPNENGININNLKSGKKNNLNNVNKNTKKVVQNENDNNKINLPGTPFSQASEPKEKEDNYTFSKKCQSDSYSSHLVSLGNEESCDWNGGIPKSASVVRFKKQIEVADELTSDYCSIETVNKVSSSSNYSQSPNEAHRELFNDYPELKFGRSTELSMKKVPNNKDTSYGFSNPNYLGPEIQTILKSKEVSKILNSPPDSVLEDTRKNKSGSLKENVELKNISGNKSKQIDFKVSKQIRSPPRYLPLRGNPYNTTTVPINSEKRKKSRASSASRAEGQGNHENHPQHQGVNENFANVRRDPPVPLSVFLIGGKEHGQVTVFKRPISLWRLRLSSNVY